MANEQGSKCKHPACDCPAEAESEYCGEYCENAEKAGVMEIGCFTGLLIPASQACLILGCACLRKATRTGPSAFDDEGHIWPDERLSDPVMLKIAL